jgi:two pore calcium channel protein, plant
LHCFQTEQLKGTLYDTENFYALSFDTFGNTLMVLFSMTVVNNWHVIASGVTAVTSSWSILYFVSFYLLAVMVIVNVIVAFFLDVFSAQLTGSDVDNPESIFEWKLRNRNRAREFIRSQHRHHSSIVANQPETAEVDQLEQERQKPLL